MRASILVANYNYAAFLRECIDSTLAQDFDGEFEVVVYDDGSTDDSLSILRSYGDRIRLISAPNHGQGHCFNQLHGFTQAFNQSTGELIFLLDSDDAFEPGKLAAVAAVFAEHPGVVAVETAGVHMDEHGIAMLNRHRERRWRVHEFPEGVVEPRQILDAMQQSNSLFCGLPTSFLAYRRGYVQQMLPIPEDKYRECAIDVRLSTPVPFYGQYYILDKLLTRYRIHGNNYFHRPAVFRLMRCNIDANRFCNRLLRRHGEKPLNFWFSDIFLGLYRRFLSPRFWKRYLLYRVRRLGLAGPQ